MKRKFPVEAVICAALWIVAAAPSAVAKFPTRLFLSADGVMLSSFPSRQNLSQTITIDRTLGKIHIGWRAVSDQAWLAVTASGETGGKLSLTADPAQLPKDQLSLAHVTVSTSGGDFSDTETLNVGAWIGSADPQTVAVQQNAQSVAMNPVSPVAYIANGTEVDEYNVYSGAEVGTLENAAPTIGALEVSSDGTKLFVADTTNYKIVMFDTATGKKIGTYALHYYIDNSFNMVYARPFGEPALFPAGGPIIDLRSGKPMATDLLPYEALAVTPDGRQVFAASYTEPSDLTSSALILYGPSVVLFQSGAVSTEAGSCGGIAVTPDGSHVYLCGTPYQIDVFDGKTLAETQILPLAPYPNNIEIDSKDRVICGIESFEPGDDIAVYNQAGYLVGLVPTPQLSYYDQQTATMKVSGDAMRVVSSYESYEDGPQYLVIRTLP